MPNNLEKIKSLFNTWANNGRSDQMAQGHIFSVEKMIGHLPTQSHYRFLDVGCGNGWVVRIISQDDACSLAMGIDISQEMINLALNRINNSFIQQFLCADFLTFNTDESFDVLFSMEAFYYIFPVEAAIKKAFELLNTNGVIIIGIDFYQENKDSHDWPEKVGVTMQLKSIMEWKNLFINAGFKNVVVNQIKNPIATEQWQRDHGTLVITGIK